MDTVPEENHGLTAEHYTEVEYLSLEEIRFFASVTLSLRPDKGMVYTYPWPTSIRVDEDIVDEDLLYNLAGEHVDEIARSREQGFVFPPCRGGGAYAFHDVALDEELFTKLISSITLTDHLLMRGLGALISAHMLWQRREFGLSAIVALYVALEASFQIIRRILIHKGIDNPSALDAGLFIHDAFDQPDQTLPDGYFSDFYEDRIKALHPSSRFGTFAFAPLMADDFYHLCHDLVAIYPFLITEHVWPKLWR